MTYYAIDIETRMVKDSWSFVDNAVEIVVVVIQNISTGKVAVLTEREEMIRVIGKLAKDKKNVLVAHNGSKFDFPVLNREFGIVFKCKTMDTLTMSYTLFPDLGDCDLFLRDELEWGEVPI